MLALRYLWHGVGENSVIYTNDIEALAIAVLVKKIRRSGGRIVYHQFEVIELDKKNGVKRLAWMFLRLFKEMDLAIFPELNRLRLFKETLGDKNLRTLLFPNTCYPKEYKVSSVDHTKKIRIGHIGELSPEGFFLVEFLDAAKNLRDSRIEFVFVGIRNPNVRSAIQAVLPEAEIIGWVNHAELEATYRSLSIGLILYKPLDFNTRYCAPNKLYEYWSFGIPVLAPELPGLIPLFDTPIKGALIDFADTQVLTSALNETSRLASKGREELISLFESKFSATFFIEELQKELNSLTRWEKFV